MRIDVKLGEPLWRSVGQRRVALEWPEDARVTIGDVLRRLESTYPGFADAYVGSALRHAYPYRLFVGGVTDQVAGETAGEQVVADGQTLFILLPAIGG